MPAKEIKASLKLDGEQKFKKALYDAGQVATVLAGEMKKVTSEFKLTGDAEKFTAEKTRILKEQIAQQRESVRALSQAVADAGNKWGENSRKQNDYRIKLNNATRNLYEMERAFQSVDREAEEFGRDSVKVGRQIERGIGEGAEEAQESMKGLIEQMQEDIGSIKGSVAFTVTNQVINTVVGAFNNLQDFVTSNQEYRRKVANFEAAARIGNHSIEEMRKVAASLGAFLGDYDTAMQAVTTLMQTGMTGSGISRAADLFAYFNKMLGEEAKVEDLAESFQESVNTGKATGKLAELAGRLGTYGISEEGLNAILGKSGTIESKALNALTYLSKAYDSKIDAIYDEQTKSLQEAAAAQIELNQAYADLADAMEPFSTWITQKTTDGVKAIKTAFDLAMGKVEEAAKEIGIDTEKTPIEDTTQALYGVEAPLPVLGEGDGFFGYIKQAWDEFKKDIFDKKSTEADGENAGSGIAEGAEKALEDARPTVQDVIDSWWAADGTNEEKSKAAKTLIDQMKPTAEETAELTEVFSQIGADINLIFGTVEENSGTSGSNAGTSFGNGFRAAMGPVVRDAWTYANQINAALASIGSGLGNVPIYGGGYHLNGAAGSGNLNIGLTSNINLNGRRLAQVVDSYQGKRATRLS